MLLFRLPLGQNPGASVEEGLLAESFADFIGMHRTFIGTIERGESNLDFSNLTKISNGLGLTPPNSLPGLRAGPRPFRKIPQHGNADETQPIAPVVIARSEE